MARFATGYAPSLIYSQPKSNLNKWIGIVQIFGLLAALILGWIMPSSFSKLWQAGTLAWISIYVIFHIWLRYLSGDRDWLSPDKLFIGAYFYFHFDYLVAYLMGFVSYRHEVFAFPAYANLTTYLISICLFSYLVGYNLKYQIENQRSSGSLKPLCLSLDWKTLLIGKIMILVGFAFVVIFILQMGLSTLLNRSYGFNLFYSGEYNYSFFSQGKSIMAVGIVFLVMDWFQSRRSSQKPSLLNLVLLAVVVIYVIAILFLFSVRSWLLLDIFMPALLIYHYFRQRVSTKFLVVAFMAVFAVSFVLELARTADTRTLAGFVDQFQENSNAKRYEFGDLITTQWRTYKNVNKSLALINAERHWFYGGTLLGGFFDSIPFAGKYLNQGWYESPSVWLARNLEPWYFVNREGIGFSLPAEMYINFGLVGSSLVFLFLGYCCARIYTRVSSLLSIIVYVTFVPNLLFSVRQTVSSFMRPVIITMLIVVIIQYASKLLFSGRSR